MYSMIYIYNYIGYSIYNIRIVKNIYMYIAYKHVYNVYIYVYNIYIIQYIYIHNIVWDVICSM